MKEYELYIQVVMEEYRSLNDQLRQAISNMFTSLHWGALLLGAVVAAALTQWNKEHTVVIIIFLGVLPLLTMATMFLWLGEGARLKRTGDYLYLIELKVASIMESFQCLEDTRKAVTRRLKAMQPGASLHDFGVDLSQPLAWEQWLRGSRGRGLTEGYLPWVYVSRLALFLALFMGSLIAGAYYLMTHPVNVPEWPSWEAVLVVLWAVSLVVAGAVAVAVSVKLGQKPGSLRRAPAARRSRRSPAQPSA